MVYVDDLLIASQDQQEGEKFLTKLMDIWKMKVTGRIGCRKKGALEFLGRSIYRSMDGESALYFGVSREYMVGIFESWGENIKAGHVGLMPKLEDVHKEYVKKFGEEPLTEKGIQRYRRVLGQLAWAALSRADLSFPISFLSRFQAKPNPAGEQCMRVFLKWLSGNLHYVRLKRLRAKFTPSFTKFKDEAGNHVPHSMYPHKAADYLETVQWTPGQNHPGDNRENIPLQDGTFQVSADKFTAAELDFVLGRLKLNKTPGHDGIPGLPRVLCEVLFSKAGSTGSFLS